ncbi:MAG: sensor histidine kinase [Xanthobacteraceae bacterium]
MSLTSGNPDQHDKLRSEQVAALYRNALPGTLASLLAAFILAGVLAYAQSTPISSAVIFVALIVAHTSGRIVLIYLYRKATQSPADWRRWARGATISALAGGLSWGFGALLLLDHANPELQMMVLLACAGIAAGAVAAFATYLPAYYCNVLSIMVPTTIWAALQGDVLHVTYAALAVLWIIAIVILARTYSRILADSLRLQFENLNLATDLRHQKELAEEANIAKSRFLASASHDLRQPVHALGMFVGALRGHDMDDEARRLVGQIDGSVNALDGLFTSLLDISRLDAGVIQANPRTFPIHQLLERICRDEASQATRKDIKLRLVPCASSVPPIQFCWSASSAISFRMRFAIRRQVGFSSVAAVVEAN